MDLKSLGSPSVASLDAQEKSLLASVQHLIAKLNEAQLKKDAGKLDSAAEVAPKVEEKKGKLIVIANRSPVGLKFEADGSMTFKMSSGGLVSAMLSVRDKVDFIWIGWLGCEVPEDRQEEVRERMFKDYKCVPVFIGDQLADAYYNGFANSELWPRFHYEHSVMGTDKFDRNLWVAYQTANRAFTDEVLRWAEPDDRIWVHDYHLMLMPQMLREKLPNNIIAWFLHTPWPSSEIYRMLPVRSEILKGLLEADLLGFHTYDYARHFISSCSRVLRNVQVAPSALTYKGRHIDVGVYAIGTEPEAFIEKAKSPECQSVLEGLCSRFEGLRVIVAVDRLDPIKGIPHRLLGLETLFRRHPQWIGSVVFLQVAVPSRTDVATYQRLTSQVNQLVGSINGEFGNLTYQPVHYMYRSVPGPELTAFYTIGDVALITSLRDGMNLVAEEYVACQSVPCRLRTAPGALVLSEFAGCAQSLSGAIRVNPWSPDDISRALHKALLLDAAEREIRWKQMFDYVSTYTSTHWALSMLGAMEKSGARAAQERAAMALPKITMEELRDASSRSLRRLFAFALEDLVGINGDVYSSGLSFDEIIQQEKFKSGEVILSLKALASDPRNTVVIGSNAGMAAMQSAFEGLPEVWLVADGGALVRMPVMVNASVAEVFQKKLDSIGSRSLGIVSVGARSTGGDGKGGSRPSITALFASTKRHNTDSSASTPAVTTASAQPSAIPIHTVRLLAASPRRRGSIVRQSSEASQAARTVAQPTTPAPVEPHRTLIAAAGYWYGVAPTVAGAQPRAFKDIVPSSPEAGVPRPKWLKNTSSTVPALLDTLAKPDADPSLKEADLDVAQLQMNSEETLKETLSNMVWKDTVRPIIMSLADQTPGSYIVETDNAIRWHFEKADPDLGAWQAKELQIHLETTLTSSPVDVRARPSFVEVKNRAGSTELAMLHIFDEYRYVSGVSNEFDFCVCISDANDTVGLCGALATVLAKQPLTGASDTQPIVPFPNPASVFLCRVGGGGGRTDAQYELSSGSLMDITKQLALRGSMTVA